jgi:hypothetical protein
MKKIIILAVLLIGGCLGQSQIVKTSQAVSLSSGEISGENQAAQMDLEATKPYVAPTGLPPFENAQAELTNQAKDITSLNAAEQLQAEAYQKQLNDQQAVYKARFASELAKYVKLQSQYDTLNGRWYVVIGRFLAIWNKFLLAFLVLAIILKGLSILPPPYGTIFSIASMAVWSVLTGGLMLLEQAIGAIAGAISNKVSTPVAVATAPVAVVTKPVIPAPEIKTPVVTPAPEVKV